jgi:hypothetical protein
MSRLMTVAVWSALGFVAGWIGAFLVWEYIYSFGESAISDETHVNLFPVVLQWGAVGGLATGAVVGLIRPPRQV